MKPSSSVCGVRACVSQLLFWTKTVVCKDAFLWFSFQLRIFVARQEIRNALSRAGRRVFSLPRTVYVYILSAQTKAHGGFYFIFCQYSAMSAASGGESLSAAPFVMLISAIVWRAPLLTFIYLPRERFLSCFPGDAMQRVKWILSQIKYSFILSKHLQQFSFGRDKNGTLDEYN
jgi:hypothetical protein